MGDEARREGERGHGRGGCTQHAAQRGHVPRRTTSSGMSRPTRSLNTGGLLAGAAGAAGCFDVFLVRAFLRELSDGAAEPRVGAARASTPAAPPAAPEPLLLGPAVELGTVGREAAASSELGAYLAASLRCGAVGLNEMRLRMLLAPPPPLGVDARCSGSDDDCARVMSAFCTSAAPGRLWSGGGCTTRRSTKRPPASPGSGATLVRLAPPIALAWPTTVFE